jgi:hypothetical protein
MKTKAQLIAQCKAENPTMVQIVNGEEIELTGAEYNAACEAWAEMQLAQQAHQAEVEAKASEKTALLARLGITAEEATLLLG